MKYRKLGKTTVEKAPNAKLRASAGMMARQLSEKQDVLVVMRVRKPDYVPKSVTMRTRISPSEYTAVIPSDMFQETLDDPNVTMVEPSRALSVNGVI